MCVDVLSRVFCRCVSLFLPFLAAQAPSPVPGDLLSAAVSAAMTSLGPVAAASGRPPPAQRPPAPPARLFTDDHPAPVRTRSMGQSSSFAAASVAAAAAAGFGSVGAAEMGADAAFFPTGSVVGFGRVPGEVASSRERGTGVPEISARISATAVCAGGLPSAAMDSASLGASQLPPFPPALRRAPAGGAGRAEWGSGAAVPLRDPAELSSQGRTKSTASALPPFAGSSVRTGMRGAGGAADAGLPGGAPPTLGKRSVALIEDGGAAQGRALSRPPASAAAAAALSTPARLGLPATQMASPSEHLAVPLPQHFTSPAGASPFLQPLGPSAALGGETGAAGGRAASGTSRRVATSPPRDAALGRARDPAERPQLGASRLLRAERAADGAGGGGAAAGASASPAAAPT